MVDDLTRLMDSHRDALYLLFRHFRALDGNVLTWSDLSNEFDSFCQSDLGRPLIETDMAVIVKRTQEALVSTPLLYLAHREGVAHWRYIQIHTEEMQCREVTVSEYLAAKEHCGSGGSSAGRYQLEVDLSPFERGFPKLTETRSIGRGVMFLNRHLSGRFFGDRGDGFQRLFDFLRLHEVWGQPLMLNGLIREVDELRGALRRGIAFLNRAESEEQAEGDIARELRHLGFAPGWGRSALRIRETMELLSDILEAPSAAALEEFLGRIPMIFSIVIVSPHGYFGQANVLGKPDTGGQVVYILDQVRALEREMRSSIHDRGLDIEPQIVVLTRLIPESGDTTCGERLERIIGTESARILRVPFRDRQGEIVPQWISRFEVWPYLERYAVEAEREVLADIGTKPDFIIGNYSDGNLVASIMSHRLGVTQCNIAHALEKTKYPQSDIRWQEQDEDFHFSAQFTADLIAMNTADFIITSTYQEIAGTADSVGQYESYGAFTLPDLYRVTSGIDCFDPKFNIVSPGADPAVFFPYHNEDRRPQELKEEILSMVLGGCPESCRGSFTDPDKPVLFAMSRLDRIKNMNGFVEWYATDPDLRDQANLLLVGGRLSPQLSGDDDERQQIEAMHLLFDEYDLEGNARWLEMETDKNRVGGLYRFVADSGGAFVQPATFEAFGLTVVEAMSSGLPVFATRFGGPLEIIEDGVSGFHIDPNRGSEASARMREFLLRSRQDPAHWKSISDAAIRRVSERYNWSLYATTLLKLSRIYGFWKYITNIERQETGRYLEMFYALMYRPLARRVAGDRRVPPVR